MNKLNNECSFGDIITCLKKMNYISDNKKELCKALSISDDCDNELIFETIFKNKSLLIEKLKEKGITINNDIDYNELIKKIDEIKMGLNINKRKLCRELGSDIDIPDKELDNYIDENKNKILKVVETADIHSDNVSFESPIISIINEIVNYYIGFKNIFVSFFHLESNNNQYIMQTIFMFTSAVFSIMRESNIEFDNNSDLNKISEILNNKNYTLTNIDKALLIKELGIDNEKSDEEINKLIKDKRIEIKNTLSDCKIDTELSLYNLIIELKKIYDDINEPLKIVKEYLANHNFNFDEVKDDKDKLSKDLLKINIIDDGDEIKPENIIPNYSIDDYCTPEDKYDVVAKYMKVVGKYIILVTNDNKIQKIRCGELYKIESEYKCDDDVSKFCIFDIDDYVYFNKNNKLKHIKNNKIESEIKIDNLCDLICYNDKLFIISIYHNTAELACLDNKCNIIWNHQEIKADEKSKIKIIDNKIAISYYDNVTFYDLNGIELYTLYCDITDENESILDMCGDENVLDETKNECFICTELKITKFKSDKQLWVNNITIENKNIQYSDNIIFISFLKGILLLDRKTGDIIKRIGLVLEDGSSVYNNIDEFYVKDNVLFINVNNLEDEDNNGIYKYKINKLQNIESYTYKK